MASSLVDDSGINLIARLNGLSQIKQGHKYDFASDTSIVNTSWTPSALTAWSLRKYHGQDRKGISAQLDLTEKSIENTIRTLVSQSLSELLDEAVYSADYVNTENPGAPKNPVPAGNLEAPRNSETSKNPGNPEAPKNPKNAVKLDLDFSTLGKMVDSAADGLENLVGSYIKDGDAVKDVNTHIINFRNLASKIRQINNAPKIAHSLSHKSVFEHYSSLEREYDSAILYPPPPAKEPLEKESVKEESSPKEEPSCVLSTSPELKPLLQVDLPEELVQPAEEARLISVHTAKEVSPAPPEIPSNPHNLPSLSYLLAQPVVPVSVNPPDPPIISDEDDQEALIRGQIRYSPPHPILNPIFREQPDEDEDEDSLKLKEDDLDDDPTEEYQEDSTDSLDLEEHPDPLTFPRMDYLSAPDGGLTASMLSFLMKEANATSVDVKPEVTETVAEVKQEIAKEPQVVVESEVKPEVVVEPEIKKEIVEVKQRPEIKKEPKIKMPKPVKVVPLKPEIKKTGPPQLGPLRPDVLQKPESKSHKHESKSQTSELRHRTHHSRQKSNVTVHAEIDWSEMKKPRVKKPHDAKGGKKIQVVHQDPFENIIDGFGQFLQALINK